MNRGASHWACGALTKANNNLNLVSSALGTLRIILTTLWKWSARLKCLRSDYRAKALDCPSTHRAMLYRPWSDCVLVLRVHVSSVAFTLASSHTCLFTLINSGLMTKRHKSVGAVQARSLCPWCLHSDDITHSVPLLPQVSMEIKVEHFSSVTQEIMTMFEQQITFKISICHSLSVFFLIQRTCSYGEGGSVVNLG